MCQQTITAVYIRHRWRVSELRRKDIELFHNEFQGGTQLLETFRICSQYLQGKRRHRSRKYH